MAFLLPSLALSTVALAPSLPLLLFSVFLLIQTSRVRFVFEDGAFRLQNAKPFTDELESSGENFVVGGENSWSYDSFVNWEFFPRAFPILVYFKETQSKKMVKKGSDGILRIMLVVGLVHTDTSIRNINILNSLRFLTSSIQPPLQLASLVPAPEEKWSEGPGSLDKVGGGQLHFFPAIADTGVLKEEFERRGCNKIE